MKQYTRKQIREAIRYWESVLKRIDESKSPLLSRLESIFGTDVVFSDNPNVDITLDNVKIIYDVLNEHMFNGVLAADAGCVDLYCDNHDGINSVLRTQYGAPAGYDISDKFALFHPKLKWMKNPVTGKPYLISLKNGIFVNLDYGTKAVILYLVSTICHEMIHCYDCLKGHLLQMTAYCLSVGCDEDEISYESHFTPVFKEMSSKMKNENGMTINITAEGRKFDELNRLAAAEVKPLAESDISGLVPMEFSDSFKKKYGNLMTFCDDGSVLMKFS